jgi:hypothetical protein
MLFSIAVLTSGISISMPACATPLNSRSIAASVPHLVCRLETAMRSDKDEVTWKPGMAANTPRAAALLRRRVE